MHNHATWLEHNTYKTRIRGENLFKSEWEHHVHNHLFSGAPSFFSRDSGDV